MVSSFVLIEGHLTTSRDELSIPCINFVSVNLTGEIIELGIDNVLTMPYSASMMRNTETQTSELPEIVKRALTQTVTDIGQLTDTEKRALNSYTKRGYLSKGKGGPFPMIKTVYAVPGFDFAAHRQAHVDYMMYLAELDRQRLGKQLPPL